MSVGRPVAVAGRSTPGARWLLVGCTAAAWCVLLAWGWSPWARLLDHDGGADLVPPAAFALFLAAWALMLLAMMLPTTAMLVGFFDRLVEGRPDRGRLKGALLGGYLAVWMGVGIGAYMVDEALHGLANGWPWLADRGWALVAAAVALAGLYQWSGYKERCLVRCRTPAGAIMGAWRGRAPLAEAFRIGRTHAASCVGCCWALMLVMFAVGAGNLGWLLLLTVVMTAEKTTRWGRALTRPVGGALVVGALVMVAVNL